MSRTRASAPFPPALSSRRALGVAALAVSLATAGCVSSSIRSDVSHVRELTKVRDLAKVADTDVDPAASEDARRILRQPLDADAAVRVALLNNRELRATLREMGVARGRLVQAGLLPNPRVEADLVPEPSTSLELRVEYDVTRALFAPFRSRAAEPDVDAARYRAAGAVVELGGRVRSAFYALQAAKQRLTLAEQALEAWAAGSEAASALFKAGNLPELELATNLAAHERARIAVAELELDVMTEREHLVRLLGVEGSDATFRLAGALPAPPAEPSIPPNVEARAVRASLELAETRERLEGLGRKAGLSSATGWVPDVSMDVHALRESTEVVGAGGSEPDWRFGGGINVSVPLFDRHQGTTTALDAEFDALLERYYGMAADVRSAAREARSRVLSAHGRARQYQNVILPAERRLTEQTLLQYNAMQVGVFQLLEARRGELRSELAYVETLREYWTASAGLQAVLAGQRLAARMPTVRSESQTSDASDSAGGH